MKLELITPQTADKEVKPLLEKVQKAYGYTPARALEVVAINVLCQLYYYSSLLHFWPTPMEPTIISKA